MKNGFLLELARPRPSMDRLVPGPMIKVMVADLRATIAELNRRQIALETSTLDGVGEVGFVRLRSPEGTLFELYGPLID